MVGHNKYFMQQIQKEDKPHLGYKQPFILPAHRFHHAAFGHYNRQIACA